MQTRDVEADEILWGESYGNITNYFIGRVGQSYFFRWTDGPITNKVPSADVEDGDRGISWHETLVGAIDAARECLLMIRDYNNPEEGAKLLDSLASEFGHVAMSTAEAAKILGVTEMRIRRLCQEGRMERKLGREWVISFLRTQRTESRQAREKEFFLTNGMRTPLPCSASSVRQG